MSAQTWMWQAIRQPGGLWVAERSNPGFPEGYERRGPFRTEAHARAPDVDTCVGPADRKRPCGYCESLPRESCRAFSDADASWTALPERLRARGDFMRDRHRVKDSELFYDAATEIELLRKALAAAQEPQS